jgi:hypothetical protein
VRVRRVHTVQVALLAEEAEVGFDARHVTAAAVAGWIEELGFHATVRAADARAVRCARCPQRQRERGAA